MNKICAAGTGSFVEEQAARMGIPLAEFGQLALSAEHPAALGERCTVFIETAIASAAAEGVPSGRYCGRTVPRHRAELPAQSGRLQTGRTAHRIAGRWITIPASWRLFRRPMAAGSGSARCSPSAAHTARPCWRREAVGDTSSQFVGFDSPAQAAEDSRSAETQRNIDFTGRPTTCFWKATRETRPSQKDGGRALCADDHTSSSPWLMHSLPRWGST